MPVNNSKEKQEEAMRLQQYMAKCGVASRRASEEIICAGRVTVNGTVVTELGRSEEHTSELQSRI